MSVNKPNKQTKDPDVWNAPPPIDKRSQLQQLKRVSKPASKNLSYNGRSGKAQGEARMNPKKTFLSARYPDGRGPDANLIEMLEREVMDKSPNVRFEDIADL
jgi:katanin p60 ATPase-containing subunit A1